MSPGNEPPAVRVWMDGAEVPAADARVSVFDRGFLYGDSVFETLRTYGGRPFALAEHLERLADSARRVLIELPVSLDVLGREIERAVERSGFPEASARVMITRGVGALGLDPETAKSPLRVLLVSELHPPAADKYERGVAVVTFATARTQDATAVHGAKIGNYLVAVLAMRAARARGAEEALITDAAGNVFEGSTSNLFVVEGGALVTPGVETAILAGITRKHVIEVARGLGIGVIERTPHERELGRAEEIFVSSSIRELLPVVRVDDAVVGDGRPGPITKALLEAFRAHARERAASA